MALIAGLAMADGGVSSQNIVGYQDKPCVAGEFTWTCPTFSAVGGIDNTFTLADIVPSDEFEAFTDTIEFCDAEGNWEGQLTYASEAFLEDNELEGYTAGWYANTDDEMVSCLNATTVPFAKGFCAYTGASGVNIRFAGEVPQVDTPVPCGQGEFTWMGNASVNNLTLADIVPSDEFEAFTDTIEFCDAEGNWEGQLTYASEAFLEDNELEGYTAGWYANTDDEMVSCLNATTVPFGKAFCAYTGASGVTITIPTPIP